MNIQFKLWVMWGILAATSVLGMILDNRIVAYSAAIISAASGWCAFLARGRR